MKILHLGFLIGALALAGSMQAQTISNGKEVGGLFQMDINVPAGNWYLQRTAVLPTLPNAWTTLAGPTLPPTFTDATSGTASQFYYRLVKVLVPSSAADCGLNRYGFIRVPVKPGFNLIADHLAADLGNGLPNLMPVMPPLTDFYQYTAGYFLDTWSGGWGFTSSPLTLDPGEGCFLVNKTATPVTVTFIGQVQEGVLPNPIPAGLSMVSSKVPRAGLLSTELGFPAAAFDTVWTFANSVGFRAFTYDPDLGGWDPSEPAIGVGEAFFVSSPTGHAWTQVFNACP